MAALKRQSQAEPAAKGPQGEQLTLVPLTFVVLQERTRRDYRLFSLNPPPSIREGRTKRDLPVAVRSPYDPDGRVVPLPVADIPPVGEYVGNQGCRLIRIGGLPPTDFYLRIGFNLTNRKLCKEPLFPHGHLTPPSSVRPPIQPELRRHQPPLPAQPGLHKSSRPTRRDGVSFCRVKNSGVTRKYRTSPYMAYLAPSVPFL